MNNLRWIVACSAALSIAACSPSGLPAVTAEYDNQTGKLGQLTVNAGPDNKPDVFSHMDGALFRRIEIDHDEDGKIDRWEYYSSDQKLEKVGLSRSNDGKVDSWAFQGPDGSIARIAVSTRRDGIANRVEFYEAGTLARAEEDTNRDARADKWETYAGGRLTSVGFDTTGSGKPNHVISYEQFP